MKQLDEIIDDIYQNSQSESKIKEGLLKFSNYDFKEQFPFDLYPERTVFGKKYISSDLMNDKTKAYFVYKALTIEDKSVEADRKCSSFDPDNSTGKCDFAKAVYSKLWGFEYEYGFFGQIKAFEEINNKKMLFGGDCLNSLQTSIYLASGYSKTKCLLEMAESEKNFLIEMNNSVLSNLFKYSHAPGNFGLVPAYFNGFRGMDSFIRDYLPQSLYYLTLEKSNYSIIERLSAYTRNPKYKNGKAEDYFQEYSSKMFKKYINAMFLWDMVAIGKNDDIFIIDFEGEKVTEINPESYKQNLSGWAKGVERFIRRRGIFMAAMLYASYYNEEEFKVISSLLYKDSDIVANGKNGYEGVFMLLEDNIKNQNLKSVFSCAKELIMEIK